MLQFLIGVMSFVTFTIDVIKYVGLRLIVLFTIALTCVMFKCSISTQLPKLSYLTLVVRTYYYRRLQFFSAHRVCIHSIPFHRFISGNEAHIQKPDDTNINIINNNNNNI